MQYNLRVGDEVIVEQRLGHWMKGVIDYHKPPMRIWVVNHEVFDDSEAPSTFVTQQAGIDETEPLMVPAPQPLEPTPEKEEFA